MRQGSDLCTNVVNMVLMLNKVIPTCSEGDFAMWVDAPVTGPSTSNRVVFSKSKYNSSMSRFVLLH